MAESAEGARLLSECRVNSSTEGSNPSLSAKKTFSEDSNLSAANFCIFGFLAGNEFVEPQILSI